MFRQGRPNFSFFLSPVYLHTGSTLCSFVPFLLSKPTLTLKKMQNNLVKTTGELMIKLNLRSSMNMYVKYVFDLINIKHVLKMSPFYRLCRFGCTTWKLAAEFMSYCHVFDICFLFI